MLVKTHYTSSSLSNKFFVGKWDYKTPSKIWRASPFPVVHHVCFITKCSVALDQTVRWHQTAQRDSKITAESRADVILVETCSDGGLRGGGPALHPLCSSWAGSPGTDISLRQKDDGKRQIETWQGSTCDREFVER